MMKLQTILRTMREAEQSAGRMTGSAQLLAASKQQPAAAIERLLQNGHRLFGENRLQEAEEKWPALKSAYPDAQLHLIGALQSKKAAAAVGLFDVIETLDREKLVGLLAAEEERLKIKRRYFIQVNTGAEPQKSGILPHEAGRLLDSARQAGLNVTGLMCLPPANEAPGLHFALLQKTAFGLGLSELSMGMSGDFETAIRFGATEVRIGTALFDIRA